VIFCEEKTGRQIAAIGVLTEFQSFTEMPQKPLSGA
jgi:hypothetical protein